MLHGAAHWGQFSPFISTHLTLCSEILYRCTFKQILQVDWGPSRGFIFMVVSPSCSLHHHTHTHKIKSSERGFNQPAFLLLLIPTCSSAREQSNRSLCDSLEICSPRALTGRTRGCCQDVSFCKSNSRSRYPQQPLNTRWDGKYISQSWINSLL